jgi:hypothetical protein
METTADCRILPVGGLHSWPRPGAQVLLQKYQVAHNRFSITVLFVSLLFR